jgi:hypothetical protein
LALRATGQFGGAGRPALRQYPHGG